MRRIHTFKSFVDEDRAQMEFPFDDKDPIHDKPTHIHVLDALESMNTMKDPSKYRSEMSLEDAWDAGYPKAFEIYKRNLESSGDEDDPDLEFIKKNWNKPEMWNDKASKFVEDKEEKHADYRDYLEVVEHFGEDECLTNKGLEALDAERKASFDFAISRNRIKETLKKMYSSNADGLIDVWRAILLRKANSSNDVYEELTKRYGGVGFYWSWKKDGAIVYHMASRGGTAVRLHGKARVEDIDWEVTIYKASYYLNNEDEVSLIEKDGLVMIEDITMIKAVKNIDGEMIDKTIDLDQPSVVSTGKYVFHDVHQSFS